MLWADAQDKLYQLTQHPEYANSDNKKESCVGGLNNQTVSARR